MDEVKLLVFYIVVVYGNVKFLGVFFENGVDKKFVRLFFLIRSLL